MDLGTFTDDASVRGDSELFQRVMDVLRKGEMPPASRPQPTAAARAQAVQWIEATLFPVDPDHPDPGRVTLRRLNRTEYRNTIRDLVGIDFDPAADFPADDSGYGFDNIGDVLTLPPTLLEKYLAAAETILERAIVNRPEAGQVLPESHRRIFFRTVSPATEAVDARLILDRFARRAWRRPVAAEALAPLVRLYELARSQGETFEGGIQVALQAVLVSPHFLFRGEFQPEPDNAGAVHAIDEFALASRLSYFLWSSLPDEELMGLAEQGTLRRRLEAQVRRMLRDPKAQALVDNFAGQWLQLRSLDVMAPDASTFPEFDAALRSAMRRETELLFAHLLRENRSVLEFLGASYSFLNERLARHYGVAGVQGDEFRKVSLRGTPRGGVLTHASVLTLTSNPTRTSPVKRGKWVLDNLLGTPPPPPPPDVPELDTSAAGALTGTLRQRMQQHRENPNCISCHERMDPIGFGLENFDGIGGWRERDGNFPVDASGRLVSGEAFQGVSELRTILVQHRREEFVRCLASKLLTYALGRGLEYYDRPAVDRIVDGTRRHGWKFQTLIHEVVRSVPFQMRRGDGDRRLAAGQSAAPG